MADISIAGSFAFRCSTAEADLLAEAISALGEINSGAQPEPPSSAMATCFPPTRALEPWSGLVDTLPDPDFPGIRADFSREDAPGDPGRAVVGFASSDDLDPGSLAVLIRGCCQETMAICPIGFEWAVTCSRPRIDEFGGGWCAIFADRIEMETTGSALSRTLEVHGVEDG